MKLTTNNNPTAILASFSTLKSMVDAKQYRSPYSILGEFIQYIIVKSHIRYFAAVEMKNHLLKSFGFDVPEAVVRTATRALKFIRTENNLYYVDGSELKDNTSFEEKKFAAETSNAEIIKLLISFIQETNTLETIMVDELTQEFIAYLLDDQQTTVIGRYTDLISRFILKYESDEKVESALKAIREGSIIYIGINRNINETGSLSRPLTLFLGTEVLFSLYGYNGEIYKQLAHDLYNQIKVANDGTKRISLCFFKDVKKEIEDFFNSATQIVEGKQQYFETVAMKAIVNGCTTAGDVYVKKADFFHALQYTYGIVEDARTSYYDMESEAYNLEELSTDQQMYDSIKIISHINKLRKGMLFLDILNSGYLAVTNTVNTLRASKEQLERVKKEKSVEYGCDYAVSVEKMTNILWYKLGNGLGGKDYPTNVSAVLKARMLLASKISQNISRVYEETRSQFITGEITEEQLASRIITLHRKPTAPEELTYDALDESLDFSIEYLTRFEEQVSRSNEALQEKDRQLKLLRDENKLIRTEKDSALAENERELQEQKIKASELEAQLEEYHKKDKAKERKRKKRKRAVRLFASLAWKLVVVAGVVIGAKLILTEQNNDLANAISIAAAVLGAIPVCISFVRNDFKKYKEADKDNH